MICVQHLIRSTPKMEKTETAILLVAQNGITETVKKILKEIPMAINVKAKVTTLCFWPRRTGNRCWLYKALT